MDICLHLGAHRTGTTSFQRYMSVNRTVLTDNAVAFWGPKRTRGGLMPGLIKNTDMLTSEDRRLARRSIGRIGVAQSALARKGFGSLIVSEENMIGTMVQNLSAAQLYPQARARLDRLAQAFGGQNLRVTLSIRNYDAHWASQIAYRVKMGAGLPDEDMLDRLATQPRRWRHLIKDIAAVFPEAEIVVSPFEGWIGHPERMLSTVLGWQIPQGLVQFNERCNASPDASVLRSVLHDSGDAEAAGRLEGHFGNFQPFPSLHCEKLQDDYREDIDWLQAGAEGFATYLDPTGDTSGGHDRPKGSDNYDIEERRQDDGRLGVAG